MSSHRWDRSHGNDRGHDRHDGQVEEDPITIEQTEEVVEETGETRFGMGPRVRVYFTGTASTAKGKSDARRIVSLLDAKRISYESVDLCMEPERKVELMNVPSSELPLLMVDGTVLGGFDDVQEMEDEGLLDARLGNERA